MRKKVWKIVAVFVAVIMVMGVLPMNMEKVEASGPPYEEILLHVPYFKMGVHANDCGISSIAMIEAYSYGYDKNSYDAMYSAVWAANRNSVIIEAAVNNGRYKSIDMDLESFYRELKAGNPILIRRQESFTSTKNQHWSVIVGYNGSTTNLEESGFIVWNTLTGVSSQNYNETINKYRKCNLTEWKKSPGWNGSAWQFNGDTILTRAFVRGTGATSGGGTVTPSSPITDSSIFSNVSVEGVTATSAKIKADYQGDTYADVGFYFGTNRELSSMTKVSEYKYSNSAGGYSSNNHYQLGIYVDTYGYKWWPPLTPETTYYYAFYCTKGGVEHISSIQTFTTMGGSSAFPLVHNGIYKICSVLSSHVIEVSNGSSQNSKQLNLWPYDGASWMCWRAVQHPDGYSFINVGTGKALDIVGGSAKEGTAVTQYDYLASDAQRFQLVDKGNGKYGMLARCSGLAVDVYGASTDPGAKLEQYAFHGGDNQLWYFEIIDTTAPSISNVRISDVDDTGYTVSCDVTDDVGVAQVHFPSWTVFNGQDDLPEVWPNVTSPAYGNTYSYRVNTADHNSEAGSYITHIYAYDAAGNYSMYTSIEVDIVEKKQEKPATAVTLNETAVTLGVGSTKTLVVTVTPADCTDEVRWESSNTSVATVSDSGVVTAKGSGEAVIQVNVGSKKASCKVTVRQPVTSISLNKTSHSMEAGQTCTLTATVSPSNASDKSIAWSSSDKSVATVDAAGKVTALQKGTATVTATAQDGSGVSKSCSLTVTNTVQKPVKTVTGVISCPGMSAGNTQTTIQLLDADGREVAQTKVDGNGAEYGLENVAAGTYTLRVSRQNCVSRDYRVTLGAEPLQLDAEVCLVGDTNKDGKINIIDNRKVYNHIAGTAGTQPLEGYDFQLGDVNGDGRINIIDNRMIYNHIADINPLWD